MSITVHLFYHGQNGSALAFAREMEASGLAEAIRGEEGNLRYDYYAALSDPETVLLVDAWQDQAALDRHHASSLMGRLAALREKYDLHMEAERFIAAEAPRTDDKFIRK